MHKQTILVVDDNEDITAFLQKALGQDYTVLASFNGNEAIQVIKDNAIDLIISDVMMPIMDGLEFCEKIKQDIYSCHIPVILLTAKNSLQSKIEGLTNGADAYIEKPFSIEHLKAQVFSLLKNRLRTKEFFASFPLAKFKNIAHTKTDEQFLATLQSLIEQRISEYDLDIDYLARAVNMSRSSFYRKIKSVSDLSPNEMINIIRLKKAAELIDEGKHNLSEISIIIGYTSLAHFSSNFKKQFGITPSEHAQRKR